MANVTPTYPAPVSRSDKGALALRSPEQSGIALPPGWSGRPPAASLAAAPPAGSGRRTALARIGPQLRAVDETGGIAGGLNFASQDHLSLAGHPAVQEAAAAALHAYGAHHGGPLSGLVASPLLLRLEERLSDLLCCREAAVFPSGWAAAFETVQALLEEDDHVLLDCLAAEPLQHAAQLATRNLHRIPHGSAEAMAGRLARVRREAPQAGILVVVESILPLSAAMPDLRLLHNACRSQGARLLVVLGHDFGATGDAGFGSLGRHGLVGEADVLIGSFASVFATTGGFAAARTAGLRRRLHRRAGALGAACTMGPVQAAIALAALEIVAGAEGVLRRARLATNIARLRTGLAARAFDVPGEPNGVVPVLLGPTAEARRMTAQAEQAGALVTLLQHPAVSRRAARWLLLVMADHTTAQVDRLVAIAAEARELALSATDRAALPIAASRPPDEDF